jgi:hypothetical protein
MMPSSTTSGRLHLLQAVAFHGNVLEATRLFKLVALLASLRLTLAAADLQQLRRTSCSRSNATSRRHSASSSLPIRQVCSFLPVLIVSIRLLPHDLWNSIMFFHVWVIVDLLYPIARVCSKSFYLRFVEICR